MTSDTSARSLQVCRSCGGGAPVDVHFCPQCTKILTLGRHGDFFAFLGLPRKLNLDPAVLDERFRVLSRQFHPDYFYNATPAERRASLERSSYLNDAYRTLKQPITRIGYLLDAEGLSAGSPAEASRQVPASLLEEVFELNEEIEAVRALKTDGVPTSEWRPRLDRARTPIEAKRDAHEAQLQALAADWDAALETGASPVDKRRILESLREQMLERNYITNLLAGIERELAQ
jgi:molecular chaperone HscB